MGPIIRKRFKFYLDPETVKSFRMVCKSRGLRANRVIEAFMAFSIKNPVIIEFLRKMEPSIFRELSKREKKIKRTIELAEEILKLLEERK